MNFKFNASSYFEKSNTLISNFIVIVKSENFALTTEVDSACWFSVDEALNVVYPNSLAQKFLDKALYELKHKELI